MKKLALAMLFVGMLAGRAHAADAYKAGLPLTAVSDAQPAQWKTYCYSADGFSVSFPSEPQLQKQNVDTQAGTFELRAYLVEDSVTALYVGICDYGDKAKGSDPDAMLQGAKNGALSNTKSHLLREKKITLGVYNGLEFEGENDSSHLYVRLYLVGTTLYQTLVVVPLGKQYDGTLRFLDSFQLIARDRN